MSSDHPHHQPAFHFSQLSDSVAFIFWTYLDSFELTSGEAPHVFLVLTAQLVVRSFRQQSWKARMISSCCEPTSSPLTLTTTHRDEEHVGLIVLLYKLFIDWIASIGSSPACIDPWQTLLSLCHLLTNQRDSHQTLCISYPVLIA